MGAELFRVQTAGVGVHTNEDLRRDVMKTFSLSVAPMALTCAFAVSHAQQAPVAALNTAAIDQALGLSGQRQGDVYRVGIPRTDLRVSVHGIVIKPGLALGSWAAFRKAGARTVVHGDLVLLDSEISAVISALQDGGLQITALHNHLIEETPSLMYLHYWGEGAEAALAHTVRTALATTKTPLTAAPSPAAQPDPGFDAGAFQKAIGRTGAVRGGVLSMSVPRPEKIMMMGVELPPAMGMATAINVQSAGAGKVAATGDFVMLDDEVNPVAKALRAHGIAITALHNHVLHGTPALYFMHFWAKDAAPNVAAGLKAAIDLLAK
jgi:biotin operon repressor